MSNYAIPSMQEIAKVKGTNGLNVVSTFSGCGGSCLGFEMAGYNVLVANEFVESARETYALNHPGVKIDPRDIRLITAKDLIELAGTDEIDVLEGSPPCASFSLSGRRDKGWGSVKSYSDTEQRADDLFFEYARLLKELQPKVFVAENVKGLVVGKAKGYFLEILKTLKAAGYRVEARVLDASYLGVPQARQRVIFVGVRNDLNKDPVFPKPVSARVNVVDAVPTAKEIRLGGAPNRWSTARQPSPTITASCGVTSPTAYLSGGGWVRTNDDVRFDPETQHPLVNDKYPTQRKYTLQEVRALSSFPADFELRGTFAQRWERLGRSVPPLLMKAVAETIQSEIFGI